MYSGPGIIIANLHARDKKVIDNANFDLLDALERHRTGLHQRIAQRQRLVGTVEDTIHFLQGEKAMSQKQLFEGFSDEQQAAYEQEAMQKYDPEIVKGSILRWKSYSTADKQHIGEEGNAVYAGFVAAMPVGAGSPQAQACVENWRRHMEYLWSPYEEQLLGLATMYNDDPRFKANFDKIDPGLAEFIREAVKIYIHNHG